MRAHDAGAVNDPPKRRLGFVVLAPALVLAAASGGCAHDDPLDPTVPVKVIAPGEFVIQNAADQTFTVIARLGGDRSGSKTVTFQHRVARLSLSACPSGERQVMFTSLGYHGRMLCFVSVGAHDSTFQRPDAYDLSARPPGIVSISGDYVFPAANGRAGVIVTQAGLRDSIPVEVRQVAAKLVINPGACQQGLPLIVGQTLHLSIVRVVDSDAIPLGSSVTAYAQAHASYRVTLYQSGSPTTDASVTPGGDFVATAPGAYTIVVQAAYDANAPTNTLTAYCNVSVP